MNHPFEVGETYRNRNGRYQVLAIAEPKMRIRYEDGVEDLVTINIQARIRQAMRDEARQEQRRVAKKKKRQKKRRKKRRGYDFSGLQLSDFKHNVAGTHWRSRPSLGGRLAQQLSETTPYEFQSYSIYRRPSVYIVLPEYYDPKHGLPYAKYELRLFPDGARYGFYVERAGKNTMMDPTWHWWRFLEVLEENDRLQEQLAQAMAECDLYWLLQKEEGQGQNYTVVENIKVSAGSPLRWKESEEISWSDFVSELRAVSSEQWLNVHLCAWTDKDDAVEAGVHFAGQVTGVFRAVLPLYLAVVGAK